ncbi:MAG: ComEC/Rec2 family competence protein [Gemmatimonadales bacterium]|nr:ComEC/Rec2 family competence protein [Gemmatimonadales bacterium]
MPAIVLVALGFVAGDVAGLAFSWAAWALAPVLAAGSALAWRRLPKPAVWFAAAAAGGVWGGAARVRAEADCRVRWRDGARLALIVEPLDLPEAGRPTPFRVMEPASCGGQIAIIMPGAAARADVPAGRRAGAPGYETALAVVGRWQRDRNRGPMFLPTRPERAGRLLAESVRPVALPLSLRPRLRLGAERRLALLFGRERGKLAAALTVTASNDLPVDLRQRYARAGLAHLLSISGFHVGILAAVLVLLLRAARVPPAPALVAGTFLVAGYVWMLGYPAPAVRSAAFVALWCWARVRQRPPVPNAALAATAVVVVAMDPLSVFEAGPWLSFTGVWGCGAAAAWWSRNSRSAEVLHERKWLRLAQPVFVSLGAVLATAPVSVLVFGTMAPAALVANIAAVPLAALVIPAIALALGLESVPGLHALATAPAAAAGLCLDLLEWVTRLAGDLPLATIEFDRRVLAALTLAAIAWVVLRPGTGHGSPARQPARLPARGPVGALAPLFGRLTLAGTVAFTAAIWWTVPPATASGDGDGRLALHFLSVGQGDAAAIRTPAGRWIVIDGGPRRPDFDAGARIVAPFLRRHGVRRIAVVVASHGDADHLGGLPAVLRTVPAELALEPGEADPRPLYREWLGDVVGAHARWRRARAGDRIEIDGVTLRVWHPDSAWMELRLPANENSVVLSVEYGGFRALFTGDAGLPMEAARGGTIGAVTLLKVGHHGSRTASGASWLAELRPALCVISVGRNNYGHPDRGILTGLAASGCAIYRTDHLGEIAVETDGQIVTLRTGIGRDTSFMLTREPR